MKIYTIGHSNRRAAEFMHILKSYKIRKVVDIRTIPRSRSNPQFNEKRLAYYLRRNKIGYLHMKELGGLRRAMKNSVNTYWRNASFRGFADYMQTKDFRKGIAKLIVLAKKRDIAIMCAEAVPWRCHRSLIADALLIRKVNVEHIFSATNCKDHKLTKSATIRRRIITYT